MRGRRKLFFSKEWASMLGGENPSFPHSPSPPSSCSAAARLEWELDAGGGFCSAASPPMLGRIKLLFCMLKGFHPAAGAAFPD